MRKHLPLILLMIVSLLAFIKLFFEKFHGHYAIFMGAANNIWNTLSPYGTDFGSVGQWYYSPFSAMFFFKPFTFFPTNLGLFLYLILSLVIFCFGFYYFLKIFNIRYHLAITFIILPQVYTAIISTKLEILMIGLILYSAALIFEKKYEWLAALILALIVNFKFQPLPIVLLIYLSVFLCSKSIKGPIYFSIFSVLFFIIPFLFKPFDFMIQIHKEWFLNLSKYSMDGYANFDNIYSFLINSFNISLSYEGSKILSLLAAISFAVIIFFKYLKYKTIEKELHLLSLAFGSAFTVLFSPLHQTNAYILYLPLLITTFYYFEKSNLFIKKIWIFVFSTTWIFMTILYANVYPKTLKLLFMQLHLKPLVIILLLILTIHSLIKNRKTL